MDDDRTLIDLDVIVPGSQGDVWRAVATGPGITSWFVPHTVEEREGGATVSSFGPGPEMQVPGRVVTWEPPHRVVFDGGEGVEGLVFEWLVEPQGADTCRVRLVNTGFGDGTPYDEQYDAMTQGWKGFLLNLKLHCEHFPGQVATPAIPSAMWAGPAADAWHTLMTDLGLPFDPSPGDRVDVESDDTPSLVGSVVARAPWQVFLLLDEPAPGTAFLTVEGEGGHVMVSVWLYLYGDEAAVAVERDGPRWQEWLDRRGLPPGSEAAAV